MKTEMVSYDIYHSKRQSINGKEFDTYKVGTVANSCSTMHKIQEKEFTLEDFSCEYLEDFNLDEDDCDYSMADGMFVKALERTIEQLNIARKLFLKTKDKKYWWQMIQLLPSSYNQTRNVMLNYEVLANIYHSRKNHKLDEWIEFCKWIETLPYSELITCDSKKANQKTGKWILMDDTYTRFKCSSCEINNIPMTYDYCPYCGCEMER